MRLERVATGLLLAGGDREGEAVDDDVLDGASPSCRSGRRSAGRRRATFHSAVRAWPSSSMVSATTAAPCSATSGMIRRDPRVRAVAVLVVHRVDDRAAAEHLQPGLEDGRLGGVEHDRQRGRGGQPAGQLAHVGDAVAADVVDAQVEQVGAVADLVAGDLDAVLPAGPRASPRGTPWSRWRWSARRSTGTTVSWRNGTAWYSEATPASGSRIAAGSAARPPHPLDDGAQVLRRGAAAAADEGQAVLAGERVVGVGQLRRASAGSARRRRSAPAGRRSACS